jgi:prophage antirepressor-like protein
MNELKIFENPEFGSIRTMNIDDEPWFVGKDVATALGYKNSRKTIADHVDDEDKGVTNRYPTPNHQPMTIINESGLYCLILGSKLPSAKKFKRWVTSEVLPAIRKTGVYKMPQSRQRDLTTDDYLKAAQIVAHCKNERLPYVLNFLETAGFSVPDVRTQIRLCSNLVKESIASFLEYCEDVENKATNLIYSQYKDYCTENNLDVLSHGEFSKQIKQCLGVSIIDKKIHGKKYRIFCKL